MVKKGTGLAKILAPFKSGWVAISSDDKKVVGHGKDLTKVDIQAKKSGKAYYFHKIIPEGTILIPMPFRKVK